MTEKYIEVIFKPGESKQHSIDELAFTIDSCIRHKCYRIALNIALMSEIDYIYIISLVSLLSEYENRGAKFVLVGVDEEIQHALKKALISDSIRVYPQRKDFFAHSNLKIIHSHIMGQSLDGTLLEPHEDSESSFVSDPTCCSIAGEYQCARCGATEYFMKGVHFEPCSSNECHAHILDWILIETLF